MFQGRCLLYLLSTRWNPLGKRIDIASDPIIFVDVYTEAMCLQSLIGYLNFCCNVVPPGRCFLRRLIDKTRNVRNQAHRVTLNRESRQDLQAWKIFVEHFNGKNLITVKHWKTIQSLHLYTDAAGAFGFGVIFDKS